MNNPNDDYLIYRSFRLKRLLSGVAARSIAKRRRQATVSLLNGCSTWIGLIKSAMVDSGKKWSNGKARYAILFAMTALGCFAQLPPMPPDIAPAGRPSRDRMQQREAARIDAVRALQATNAYYLALAKSPAYVAARKGHALFLKRIAREKAMHLNPTAKGK
jgi:hypothetical protein